MTDPVRPVLTRDSALAVLAIVLRHMTYQPHDGCENLADAVAAITEALAPVVHISAGDGARTEDASL